MSTPPQPQEKEEPTLTMSMFTRTFPVLALHVAASQHVDSVTKLIGRKSLLHRNGINPIFPSTQSPGKIILLDPTIFDPDKGEMGLPTEQRDAFREAGVVNFIRHDVQLDYSHATVEEAMKILLGAPANIPIPSAFETVGHVAHLNLRDEHIPFKHRIAQIILDKSPNIKTVVNKTGVIETQFRTFPMEILAGEHDLNVEVKAHGFRFRFDYEHVYWNSRLTEEHRKLCERFTAGDIVMDTFCGVGPFAVRAAKRQCRVFASDLNPNSFTSLVNNLQLNKIQRHERDDILPPCGWVMAKNLDARLYIRELAAHPLLPLSDVKHHLVMNLPNDAPEFLDSLIGAFSRERWHGNLPHVHCYCFCTSKTDQDRIKEVMDRISAVFGHGKTSSSVTLPGFELRQIRDVAPNKLMMCAHFQVPEHVAFGGHGNDDGNRDGKRSRVVVEE